MTRAPGTIPTPMAAFPRLQRSIGVGRISFKVVADGHGAASTTGTPLRTALDDLEQSGCIRLRLPRAEPRVAPSAVLINTAGGLTDGDELRLAATWAPGTLAAVTSQAAERIYRARRAPACIETLLSVGSDATGLWLPQETILFNGGRYRRRIEAEIQLGGSLLACESLIVGRRAMGERVTSGFVHDGWRIRYDGRLLLADALRLDGDLEALLDRPAIGHGARAIATIVLAGAMAEACLTPARGVAAMLGPTAGVSLIGSAATGHVLVARLLAADGAHLRKDLTTYLDALLQAMSKTRPNGDLALPRSWYF